MNKADQALYREIEREVIEEIDRREEQKVLKLYEMAAFIGTAPVYFLPVGWLVANAIRLTGKGLRLSIPFIHRRIKARVKVKTERLKRLSQSLSPHAREKIERRLQATQQQIEKLEQHYQSTPPQNADERRLHAFIQDFCARENIPAPIVHIEGEKEKKKSIGRIVLGTAGTTSRGHIISLNRGIVGTSQAREVAIHEIGHVRNRDQQRGQVGRYASSLPSLSVVIDLALGGPWTSIGVLGFALASRIICQRAANLVETRANLFTARHTGLNKYIYDLGKIVQKINASYAKQGVQKPLRRLVQFRYPTDEEILAYLTEVRSEVERRAISRGIKVKNGPGP